MDDETQAIVMGIVRHFIGAAGAYLAASGMPLTGTQMDTVAGFVMVLIAVGLSWRHKTTVQAKP